jgi:predicted transcriptional regulator
MRRHTLGWSQDRLAAEIGGGMTQVNVGLIERGERDPLTSTTIRILAALGLALDVVDSEELAA